MIERLHRTIKRMAERSGCSPLQAVFWYNMAPKDGTRGQSVPSSVLHRYEWRHPSVQPVREEGPEASVRVGDFVLVKPPKAKCTSRWKVGQVTRVTSNNNVEVDGVPRHILDIRPFGENAAGRSTRSRGALSDGGSCEDEDEDGPDVGGDNDGDGDGEDENRSGSGGDERSERSGRPVRERRAPVWCGIL